MIPMTSSRPACRSTTASALTAVFGLFFVPLRQPVHRFDGLTAFFGHGQGVDERGGKRAAAGEREVERMPRSNVGDDLVCVLNVVIAARARSASGTTRRRSISTFIVRCSAQASRASAIFSRLRSHAR